MGWFFELNGICDFYFDIYDWCYFWNIVVSIVYDEWYLFEVRVWGLRCRVLILYVSWVYLFFVGRGRMDDVCRVGLREEEEEGNLVDGC